MIYIYLENGVAHVWNSEDWFELRTKHRICGSLIGAISSHPRQNDFKGLPMALMTEEAALLIEKGICELYSLPNLTQKPSETCKEAAKDLDQKLLQEQSEALRKRRIEQISQKIDIIIAGKRKKLLAKGMPDIPMDKETYLQEEISKLPPLAPAHVLVYLPTEHHMKTDEVKMTIQDLEPSISGEGAVKYAVYKDLWEQGLYITEGLKFGCDFLVYPGDPVKFHAMYMIRCVGSETVSFQPSTLVAFGRLSVAVNKIAVVATCGPQNQINYQTLQWHDSVNG
ncbi:unnamed protein product [Plutella xylostella]|uniref:tRNA-splicing endonuclease subunit Sen34 n=1 Tax=Plutella xylostella TaxID=51655 RepID=A0A8S4D2E5_PLUXY|nr:unnamed protein product [Plutella xylostella]